MIIFWTKWCKRIGLGLVKHMVIEVICQNLLTTVNVKRIFPSKILFQSNHGLFSLFQLDDLI